MNATEYPGSNAILLGFFHRVATTRSLDSISDRADAQYSVVLRAFDQRRANEARLDQIGRMGYADDIPWRF